MAWRAGCSTVPEGPSTATCMAANSGSHLASESLSSNWPRSISISAATDTTGLVIE